MKCSLSLLFFNQPNRARLREWIKGKMCYFSHSSDRKSKTGEERVTESEGEIEPENEEGGGLVCAISAGTVCAFFQTGVTRQRQTLTNNQRHGNITIKWLLD